MPKWICENCGASMTVKDSHIGTEQACIKCGQRSIVPAGIETNPFTAMLAKDGVQPDVTLPSQPDNSIRLPEESVSSSAKTACVVIILVAVLLAILVAGSQRGAESAVFWAGIAIGLTVQAVMIWPFYTMADDTRANRRLLEALVNRQSD